MRCVGNLSIDTNAMVVRAGWLFVVGMQRSERGLDGGDDNTTRIVEVGCWYIYIYTIMSIINKDAFFGYSFDFVLEIPPPSLGFAIYCNVNSYISI